VTVPNPDIKGRREILILYLSKIKHDSSVDIEKLAKMTVGTIGSVFGLSVSTVLVIGPTIFSSRIRIQTFFHPESRIVVERWNTNLLFSCFLCLQEQSLNLSHSQKDPGSGKFIPGVKKKVPDPGSGYATQKWTK
jgi:hypothetical protein